MKKLYISPDTIIQRIGTREAILQEDMIGCSDVSLYDLTCGKQRGNDPSIFQDEEENKTGGFGTDNGPWDSIW